MSFLSHLATCFGIGNLRPAPGTWGTLVAVPFGVGLALIDPFVSMLIVFLMTVIALLACESYEKELGIHDSPRVVIDEFASYLIAVMWLPFTWQSFVFAFVLFRILDITKPLFIGYIDRKVKGGVGTLADDIAAGIVTNVLLQIVFYQTSWLGMQWSGGFTT